MKTFKQTTIHIEETNYPALRDLLGTLSKDGFSNISFFEEDNSGEIEIFVNENFKKSLSDIINELKSEFEEEGCDQLDDYELNDLPTLEEFSKLVDTINNDLSLYYNKY